MLVLTRKKGQSITLDFSGMSDEELIALRTAAPLMVAVVELRGDRVRLGFDAPRSVAVHRQESFEMEPG